MKCGKKDIEIIYFRENKNVWKKEIVYRPDIFSDMVY